MGWRLSLAGFKSVYNETGKTSIYADREIYQDGNFVGVVNYYFDNPMAPTDAEKSMFLIEFGVDYPLELYSEVYLKGELI